MILTNSRNNIFERSVLEGSFDLGGAQRAVETEDVSDETGDMWGGHRSAGKDLSRSIVRS